MTAKDPRVPDATHVATLVSRATVLDEGIAQRVAGVLPGAAPARWLAPGIAVDVPFAPGPAGGNAAWGARVREALAGAPVDAVVQLAAGRRKRLLVADMDATMVAEECIDELAALAGRREAVSALTRASVRGEMDFECSLRRRVALLAGCDAALVEQLAGSLTVTPGAATLVATMRARGATAALASGGFTHFTAAVAARLRMDHHHGNALEIADGRLLGTLRKPVLGPAAKADILRALRDELELQPAETLAVGDGANDLGMLAAAGLGVAFHAAPAVAAAAPARIDHSDLSALLYLQGYARDEFIEGDTGW